jgi:hypothetical protein
MVVSIGITLASESSAGETTVPGPTIDFSFNLEMCDTRLGCAPKGSKDERLPEYRLKEFRFVRTVDETVAIPSGEHECLPDGHLRQDRGHA